MRANVSEVDQRHLVGVFVLVSRLCGGGAMVCEALQPKFLLGGARGGLRRVILLAVLLIGWPVFWGKPTIHGSYQSRDWVAM